MNAGNVRIKRVDVRVVAYPPDGWTVEELREELVDAGNDPECMIVLEDRIVVVDTTQTENSDG